MTDAERIKHLMKLCEQLDMLRKQAEEIYNIASDEIVRARRANLKERRTVPAGRPKRSRRKKP